MEEREEKGSGEYRKCFEALFGQVDTSGDYKRFFAGDNDGDYKL